MCRFWSEDIKFFGAWLINGKSFRVKIEIFHQKNCGKIFKTR